MQINSGFMGSPWAIVDTDGRLHTLNYFGDVEVSPRKQTPTGSVLQVQVGPGDVISNLPVVIQYEHHQVHEGETFVWSRIIPNLNGIFDVRLSTASGIATIRTPHFLPEVVCESTSVVSLFEGTTFTSGGTLNNGSIFNRNRNINDPANINLYISGTGANGILVSSLGTQIYQGMTLGGNKGTIAAERATNEYVLKPSTEYLFRVNTVSAGSTLLRLNWYSDLGV